MAEQELQIYYMTTSISEIVDEFNQKVLEGRVQQYEYTLDVIKRIEA